MAPKIVIFAPDRRNEKMETVSAKVSFLGDREKLATMLDERFADLVILLDAPAELRRQMLAAAKKSGKVAVVCLNENRVPAVAAEADNPNGPTEPLEKARRYMDDNFRQPLTLAEIASHAGVSAGYFCRRFKLRYQLTPIMYLRNLRIAHATHLLLNTDLPLSAITDQSGFFSISYFCREFHKIKGLAPITFRRQNSSHRII